MFTIFSSFFAIPSKEKIFDMTFFWAQKLSENQSMHSFQSIEACNLMVRIAYH